MKSRRASASCSSATLAIVALGLLLAAPVEAKVFHSRQDALRLAFPEADRIEKQTFILDSDQSERIEQAARAALASKLVTIFTAWKDAAPVGYAHIDVHTVRTHPSALLVAWTPAGEVRSVRVLAFHEPLDYLPAGKWYDRFTGKTRASRLRVGDDVHGVVNATLSTRVAAASVRRALAYHAILIAPALADRDGAQEP